MSQPQRNVALEQLVKISTIGTNFAFAVGGMGLIGWGLDYAFHTGHKCLLGGLAVGLLGGGYRFIREARAASATAAQDASKLGGRSRRGYGPDNPGPTDE